MACARNSRSQRKTVRQSLQTALPETLIKGERLAHATGAFREGDIE